MKWGLLGPETLPSLRRTRTLGLGVVVRHYNEEAVPGMGNVWFARQLYLALLGIAVAEKAREAGMAVSNIETANAIEALACRLALVRNDWQSDPRLRGSEKLKASNDTSFARLRKRGAYVTQPMRMATVQPLRELGFVVADSERFNAYRCTDLAHEFIERATQEYRPYRRTVLDNLLKWSMGDDCVGGAETRAALSPLERLSGEALAILRNQIVSCRDGADRRRSVMNWVSSVSDGRVTALDWENRPHHIDESHWLALKTGGIFFQLRDEALHLLDLVEARLGQCSTSSTISITKLDDEAIKAAHKRLNVLAQRFMHENHDTSPGGLAGTFCNECGLSDPAEVIAALVKRDGHVLSLHGSEIIPGPAFGGAPVEAQEADGDSGADENEGASIAWPTGISARVKNLFYMNADLKGDLERWLSIVDAEVEDGA